MTMVRAFPIEAIRVPLNAAFWCMIVTSQPTPANWGEASSG